MSIFMLVLVLADGTNFMVATDLTAQFCHSFSAYVNEQGYETWCGYEGIKI